MNSLDSRVIGFGDCYSRVLSQSGRLKYAVVAASGVDLPIDDEAFEIKIKKRSGKKQQKQHVLMVRRSKSGFKVDQPKLEVTEGDVVTWHAANARTPGFAIRGKHGRRDFDSACLDESVVFTHAFGSPGDYHWIDAHGRKIGGVVKVRSPEKKGKSAQRAWLKQLGEGVVVQIKEDKVSPAKVSLVTGQTVFWAIDKAPGISITDRRLLGEC